MQLSADGRTRVDVIALIRQQLHHGIVHQGLDLSAFLELPEDGEEPWNRSVDMAHHSVDWREVSKQVSYVRHIKKRCERTLEITFAEQP